MASSSPAPSDHNRLSTVNSELQSPDPSRTIMHMDDLMKSFWPADPDLAAGINTVDQVWKDITGGPRPLGAGAKDRIGEMTLEDFLAKAGVGRDEDVTGDGGFGAPSAAFSGGDTCSGDEALRKRFGFGEEGEGGARAKRKAAAAAAALSEPVDRAAQQRQRRMIKNRESAARSRERKMVYTQDLKELELKLQEENLQLVNEQSGQQRRRYKHVNLSLSLGIAKIMTYVIPVAEGRKPRRMLRRTRSVHW